jgi:hypothetical protein
MRLRTITEDITKREFFDFYALEQAYNRYPDNKVIKQYLEFYADVILKDHLGQFVDVLVDRLTDVNQPDVVRWMKQLGLGFGDRTNRYQMTGIDKLSIGQKIGYIRSITGLNSTSPSKPVFLGGHWFTGGVWNQFGKDFLNVYDSAQRRLPLKSKILAIDKLYNMVHHSGQVTDHMDEVQWIEDALNIRDNATPAQIFALASSNVRAAISRNEYSVGKEPEVSDIRKLYTALRRYAKSFSGITFGYSNDKITIQAELPNRGFATITVRDDGDRFVVNTNRGGSRLKKDDANRLYGIAQILIDGVFALANDTDNDDLQPYDEKSSLDYAITNNY